MGLGCDYQVITEHKARALEWHVALPTLSQGKVGHFNLAEWLCMTIELCPECPVRNNKEAICQLTRHQEWGEEWTLHYDGDDWARHGEDQSRRNIFIDWSDF